MSRWRYLSSSDTKKLFKKPEPGFFLYHQKALLMWFFPFLSKLSRFKSTNGSGVIYDAWIGLHKFANVIFGIIQKPLHVTSSNLVW